MTALVTVAFELPKATLTRGVMPSVVWPELRKATLACTRRTGWRTVAQLHTRVVPLQSYKLSHSQSITPQLGAARHGAVEHLLLPLEPPARPAGVESQPVRGPGTCQAFPWQWLQRGWQRQPDQLAHLRGEPERPRAL